MFPEFIKNKYIDWRLRLRNLPWTEKMDYGRKDIRLHIRGTPDIRTRIHSCKNEPNTVKWIETFLAKGGVFYDIGANIGAYSLVASKCSDGRAKVFAFEPAFTNFPQLCENVILNDCSKSVFPMQICLSDKMGLATFYYKNFKPGGSGHQLEQSASKKLLETSPFPQRVLTMTMDQLVSELDLPQPNYIKIDVDGAEEAVLSGAKQTLANPDLKAVQMEYDEANVGLNNRLISIMERSGLELQEKAPATAAGTSSEFLFCRK